MHVCYVCCMCPICMLFVHVLRVHCACLVLRVSHRVSQDAQEGAVEQDGELSHAACRKAVAAFRHVLLSQTQTKKHKSSITRTEDS